jgi:hypothetical protein
MLLLLFPYALTGGGDNWRRRTEPSGTVWTIRD